MPTNLPPEYYAIEERYKAAQTPEEQVELLEELISTIPKHKGTDHLRADLRRRLSKLKERGAQQKKTGKVVSPYIVDKEGAGQMALIGFANVGKSTLVAELTNAAPEVSPHPFTTWQPTPGMMALENIQVQVIDTPPIDREFVEPEFYVMLRRADLILLMVDLEADALTQMNESIRLLVENRVIPAHLADAHPEPGNRVVPLLVLGNKFDDESADENYHIFCELAGPGTPCLPVSAVTKRNIEEMKRRIFETLDVIRIYAKPFGEDPDLSAPFVLARGSTVEQFALQLHRDFYENLKTARVWGSADFDGQQVSREYVLQDGDVVELKI
jgi:ribosome-interacting GTPase 1